MAPNGFAYYFVLKDGGEWILAAGPLDTTTLHFLLSGYRAAERAANRSKNPLAFIQAANTAAAEKNKAQAQGKKALMPPGLASMQKAHQMPAVLGHCSFALSFEHDDVVPGEVYLTSKGRVFVAVPVETLVSLCTLK